MLESFHRTAGVHSFCQSSEIQCFSFRRQCRFFRTAASISLVHALAPCSLLLLLIHRAARSPGQLRASAVSWQRCIAPVSGGSSTCCGCQRGAARDGAVQHRPNHQRPPRGRPLPCACCRAIVVAWKARSALPAAAVPVRPFRRGPEYHPSPTEL